MTETPQGHERFPQARERIQRGMVERGIPSLTIAVAQGNTMLWEEGFGWADRERRIAATPHTLYSLASISKPITATALMILKERGLLGLDHPLLGQWRGYVHTYEGDIPLTLWFKETGDVHAQFGTQLKTLVNETQFKKQSFEGKMMGDMSTPDANRYPHHLYLDLKLREEVFTGAVIALPIREKTPGKRLGMALSHWVELRKDH